MADEAVDLLDEVLDAVEGTPADGLLRDESEPARHLTRARGVATTRREKQVVIKNCLRNRGYKVLN